MFWFTLHILHLVVRMSSAALNDMMSIGQEWTSYYRSWGRRRPITQKLSRSPLLSMVRPTNIDNFVQFIHNDTLLEYVLGVLLIFNIGS